MSNYKRVLKHLNKEELAAQKVELALIDDLRQIVKEGSKLYESYVNDMDDAKAVSYTHLTLQTTPYV